MPFHNSLRAQTSAFDHGCGLHCVAHGFVLNLMHNRFSPELEETYLNELLVGFKAEYPGAHDLTTAELKKILVEDLKSPLHREVVLSRVLRRMLLDRNYQRPGVDVTDDHVLYLAGRLGMRLESYTPMRIAVLQHLRSRGIHHPTPADLKRAEEEIRASEVYNVDENDNVSLKKEEPFCSLPPNAPRLKIMNQHGGHFEWEYNIHKSRAKNLEEVARHNALYASHSVNYGNNYSNNVSVYADELHPRVNSALLRRAELSSKGKNLTSAITEFEQDIARREGRKPAPAGAFEKSSANKSFFDGDPFKGLSGFLAPLFNAFMPAFMAPASKPAMNTAIPVVGNVLHALRDMLAPAGHKEAGFTDEKARTGHNGTKFKGSFFSLVSTVFDWVGNVFNFFGGLIGFAEKTSKMDPSRPLEESDLKTEEDRLIYEYMQFLPENAINLKKRLCAGVRNSTVSKEQLLQALKDSLLENNLQAEHDELLFKSYLTKIDPKEAKVLKIQYQRLNGHDIVWDRLSRCLLQKGFINKASSILARREFHLLHEGFIAKNGMSDPALQDACQYYGQALEFFKHEKITWAQYKARLKMMDVIKKGNNDGSKILKDLTDIFEVYKKSHEKDPHKPKPGFDFASGFKAGEKDTHDKCSPPPKPQDTDGSYTGCYVPGYTNAKRHSPRYPSSTGTNKRVPETSRPNCP